MDRGKCRSAEVYSKAPLAKVDGVPDVDPAFPSPPGVSAEVSGSPNRAFGSVDDAAGYARSVEIV
jgi:hypothetical protein